MTVGRVGGRAWDSKSRVLILGEGGDVSWTSEEEGTEDEERMA